MAACACVAASAQYPYKVIAPLPDVEDGDTAVLVNYDTVQGIDTAVISDHTAVFTGELDEPYMACIAVNGKSLGSFIVEQGTCAFNPKERVVKGAYLNDQLNAIFAELEAAEHDAIADLMLQAIDDNADNPIGYYVFLEYLYTADAADIMAALEKYPDMKKYARVQRLTPGIERKLATSGGRSYVDFEVEHDGKTYKLSDYVGYGRPVLVDFWARWRRPCMQEINGTLKDIYAEYADKGLDVLGVAVWDEPANTEAAIKRAEIPWPCILNAQTIPTDAYGIAGIPCIILFAPDGTIVCRDLQGDELKQAVSAAMAIWGSEQ